jgi:hypothetical protein
MQVACIFEQYTSRISICEGSLVIFKGMFQAVVSNFQAGYNR